MRHLFTLLLISLSFTLSAQIPCNGTFLTVGSAMNTGSCIQLTPNLTGQQGCTWLNTPVDFSMPFTHNMVVNFGSLDANGADGICLIYQTNGPGTCGNQGGGIGAQGIPNSFIVEFDTWNNGAGMGDIPNDHCAVDINGDLSNPINGPADLGNIEDGANHSIGFTWDPATMSYTITFDGGIVLSGVFDIVNTCFGGNNLAYWGYSASTGAATNTQKACPVLPPPIIADAGIDVTVPCSGFLVTLDGSGSSMNATYTYQWTTSGGHIVSGANTLNPLVDEPGTYILTLTDINGGCMEIDQVVVGLDPLVAAISPPPLFPCNASPVILDGSSSSSGPFISYQWSTNDGIILTSSNNALIEVGSAGNYTLTVTYSDGNGGICSENTTVFVMDDFNIPVANALNTVITCDPGYTIINGLGSSTGNTFSYQWTTFDGLIISDEFTLFPTVGAPGNYTLIVTNTINGCFDEITVEVSGNLETPTANAIVANTLSCQNPSVTIDGSTSAQGNNISYEWITINGNILTGADTHSPTVNAPGEYTLIVTNEDNGCFEFADVTVQSIIDLPNIIIQSTGVLSCSTAFIELDATLSDQGANFTYAWTTAAGNIVSGINSLNPIVDVAGTYELTITNNDNGCFETSSITVQADFETPLVDAGSPQTLACDDDFLVLNGSASGSGGIGLTWSTSNGNIISNNNIPQIQVDAAGTYLLEATNLLTGCSAIDSVLIDLDNDVPFVSLVANDTLNCTTDQILIDATDSNQGNEFTFSWSSVDGHFVSGQNSLQALVDAPGTYTLQITNTLNDCTNGLDIEIIQDTLSPIIDIASPDTLNCLTNQVVLDASLSAQGSVFTYDWSTVDGNIINANTILNPIVNAPGTYVLSIDNTQNNCSSISEITVAQDTLSPTILILEPGPLNCNQTSLNLDATGSSSGPSYNYSWSTNEGNIINGNDGLNPLIDAPGIYNLLIINTDNGCLRSEILPVEQDISSPDVNAGPDMTLNCYSPSLQLDGSGSSSGSVFSITWSEEDNGIIDNTNNLSPVISDAGTYILEIVNMENGCSGTDTVSIAEDFLYPASSIALPSLLTCTDSLSQLDGSASSMGSNITYSWASPNGNIASGAGQAIAQAAQPGQYFLTIQNIDNGCTATDSTTVLQDEAFPIANIDDAPFLSCAIQSIVLQGTASSNSGNFNFQWETPDGNFVSGDTGLTPTINQPGTYILMVTDLDNNCQSIAGVDVLQDISTPLVSPGVSQELNCNFPSLQLDGSASDQGSQLVYSWSTANGNILSGADGLTPQVDAAGNYLLTINNLENGCADSAMVMVTENFSIPDIDIITPDTLFCNVTEIQLMSSTGLSPTATSYSWTTQNGNIQSGAGSANPTVNAPGTYQLTLENSQNGCSAIASAIVYQDTQPPLIQLSTPEILSCALIRISLSSSGSNIGAQFSYTWNTNNGNIINGINSPNPEVDQPGIYQLEIINTLNGCSATDEIAVLQDIAVPAITIIDPLMLNCTITALNLDASGSSNGSDFTYSWLSPDGNIVDGANSLMPLIDQPGSYTLNIQNTINGCADSQSVNVQQDITIPEIEIQDPVVLNCSIGQQFLNATNSSSGAQFVYDWMSSDGHFLEGADSPTPLIDEPGTYTLHLSNTQNNCENIQSIIVGQDISIPDISIAQADQLNCNVEQINLDASGSSVGIHFDYEWTTIDGNILSGASTLNPLINQPGAYNLLITNADNGCDTLAVTIVTQDIVQPTVNIQPPEALNCIVESIFLDATSSSSGSIFEYNWTTTDGNILSGVNNLMPHVNEPGTYTLQILNSENFCFEILPVLVEQDTVPPIAEAGNDFILPCFNASSLLNGNGSSEGPPFLYQWATNDGSIVSGSNSLYPNIDAPGTYSLLVSNTDNGCESNDQVSITQSILTAEALFIPPACYGSPATIIVQSVQEGLPPYLYSIDGGDSFHAQPIFDNLEAGYYDVAVQDVNGCLYEEFVDIAQPDSVVIISTIPEATIQLGETYQIYTQSNLSESEIASISWQHDGSLSCDDCPNPIASPLQTTDYRVRIRTINGCEDIAQIRIYVDRRNDVYIPNAFSPNTDGANDIFYIFARTESVKQINSFQIFSRWGEAVFEAYHFQPNDPKYGWNGRFRGELFNAAVFVYVAEIEFVDGQIQLFKGSVTLTR
ncbi:MAG: gliding motility-associated C-terminal domain-containing protein [Phaeodactylibacter sp.]|nr:gliding motility-associated C-terminal domain-containing protein [Phaeodactylibacter sp.]